MPSQRVVWKFVTREIEPHEDAVSAIGLNVSYQDRETYINIVLPQPIVGQTPENEAGLDELRHLRDALNDILDRQ